MKTPTQFGSETPRPCSLILKRNGDSTNPKSLGLVMIGLTLSRSMLLVAAGPDPVNLGSTAHFAVLAGAAITTTGGGAINGDVGASPIAGSAIHLTQAQVHGTIYAVDASGPAGSVINAALLTTAKGDLMIALKDAAGRTPVPSGPFLNPGAGTIGGLNLGPGLYQFTGTAMITGSNLTLTGGPDDVWIFQIASNLDVGSTVQIILAGGAQGRNVFWQVGTSATIGTFSVFVGTILASQSVTMNTSSSLDGRALAFSAGVTFNGNSGVLPEPKAPIFTRITEEKNRSIALEISTTPYFLITLQSSPTLYPAIWSTIASTTPSTSLWPVTDTNATAIAPRRFYRAVINQ